MQIKKSLQEKLRDLRYNNGNLKLEQVSNATGISTTALSTYENDELKDIPHSSIVALAKFYKVSTDYLLGLTEIEQENNTELSELSIDDEVVILLKSGRINNRLLCELIAHPSFIKFLTDLEIYIDGKAAIQIQNLNALVDMIRETIINETSSNDRPLLPEDERSLKMLEVAHINDDLYFFNLLHQDIDSIAKDLREDHMNDADTVPDNMIAEQISNTINEVRAINDNGDGTKKNLLDLLMYYFAKELRMPLDKFTAEEKEMLKSIFERSGRYKAELRNITKGRKKKL